jgi:DNA topoisomerase-1
VSKDAKLTSQHKKIYELIYNRALSTQMKEAQVKEIALSVTGPKGYMFEASSSQVLFDGFLKLINPDFVKKHKSDSIYKTGDNLTLNVLEAEAKDTLPPYRYTEASLIRTLEARGIGRPSTFAPTVSLIQTKRYVDRDGRYLKPTELGIAISDYLSSSFPELFNVDFTARMEENLDKIAEGQEEMMKVLKDFYNPFNKELESQKDDDVKIVIKEETDEKCPTCGKNLLIRFSKFGKFYACSGYPDCKFTKTFQKIVEGRKCPKDGGDIVVRYSKAKRRFYGCANYPKCDYSAFAWSQLPQKTDEGKK